MKTRQLNKAALNEFEMFDSAIDPKKMSRELIFLFLDYITASLDAGDPPDDEELIERARTLRHLLWLLHGIEDSRSGISKTKKS